MNLKTHQLFRFTAGAILVALSIVVTGARADDTMAAPNTAAQIASLHYLEPGKPDATNLLAPPPFMGSPEQAADMATVHEAFHAASSNDIAAAYAEKKFDAFTFTPAIGDFFRSGTFPETEKFLKHVQDDAEAVTDSAKEFYRRPRPFTTDPSLANGKLEKSFSYPSGHSTESMVLALVLADLFPEKRDAILATARGIGWHRVQIARHYPTDIYAGRVLAQAIVKQLKKDGKFQRDFAAAKAEVDRLAGPKSSP